MCLLLVTVYEVRKLKLKSHNCVAFLFCTAVPSADMKRSIVAVTCDSFYDTLLTCFQYGAPKYCFTSQMGWNTIPLGIECGARRPGRMGLRLTGLVASLKHYSCKVS